MRYTILILALLAIWMTSASMLTYQEFDAKYDGVVNGIQNYSEEQLTQMFQDFLVAYKKNEPELMIDYKYSERFQIFRESVERVASHNQDHTKTWKRGINKFSDMTDEEFLEYYNLNAMAEQECSATSSYKLDLPTKIPDSIDWRDYGFVTPVKNQGGCGSCWTFSTVGSLESYALKSKVRTVNGTYPIFAEQQLVDCPGPEFDSHGCAGGLPSYAFNYISTVGLAYNSSYPYKAKETGECLFHKEDARVFVDGSYNITEGDEVELTQILATEGVVSVAFQVVGDFRDYKSGVYKTDNCGTGPMDVNHAVLAVGYGTDSTSGLPYYTIKNSWGPDWGNEGYFNMERGTNMCAIATCNSIPTGLYWWEKDTKVVQSFLKR